VRFGIASILAAIISGPVTEAESNLFGWTPPSVTVIRQMSPKQMDELAREMEQHIEQLIRSEHSGEHSHGS
jgi:hypothetical protein